MINTLTKSILKKTATSQLDIPKIEQISPETMPTIFYTENFYKQQKNNIKLGEILEEQMKYHLVRQSSVFDKDAKTDMLYPYMHTMKVNRDLNMIMAKGYFGSHKPQTCVIGNQATARYVRYLQDLEYDAVACDSKRNFTDFTNYILTLNGLKGQNAYTGDKYEFLCGKQFECIDIEVDYTKPYQLAVPALRAVKEGGLLIYNILQYVTNTRSIGKLNTKKLNLFHDKIACNSETFMQGAVSRFEEIAHDLGKNVEMLFTLTTGNDIGHLTMCMSVHNGKKPIQHFHSYCSTCGQYKSGCEKEEFCSLSGIGPLQIRSFNQNKQFIDKCLQVKKFTNWDFIEELLLCAKNIPEDAYLFYINKYYTGEQSYNFYEYLGTDENYFVAKSPYHNMLSIYTNMPWELLMGKVHKYILEKGLQPNPYVESFPVQDLIRKDVPNPVKIEYPIINTLTSIPRVIKERRQRDYGWKDI